jgi:hypothetical protein
MLLLTDEETPNSRLIPVQVGAVSGSPYPGATMRRDRRCAPSTIREQSGYNTDPIGSMDVTPRHLKYKVVAPRVPGAGSDDLPGTGSLLLHLFFAKLLLSTARTTLKPEHSPRLPIGKCVSPPPPVDAFRPWYALSLQIRRASQCADGIPRGGLRPVACSAEFPPARWTPRVQSPAGEPPNEAPRTSRAVARVPAPSEPMSFTVGA